MRSTDNRDMSEMETMYVARIEALKDALNERIMESERQLTRIEILQEQVERLKRRAA